MKRFIRYLYEYEQGRRTRNVGFVKVDVSDGECVVHIHGKGLRLEGEPELSIYLFYKKDGECIGIFQGTVGNVNPAVNYQLRFTKDDVGDAANYPLIEGIIMENSSHRKYAAVWNDMPVNVDEMRPFCVSDAWTPQKGEASEEERQRPEERPIPEEHHGPEEWMLPEERMLPEEQMPPEEADLPGTRAEERVEEDWREATAEEWQEASAPQCERAQCGRACTKIQRKDIAVLPRCEWKLANNSFLLHGYYNYHHLVLIEEDGNRWLGVPGIYHPKEEKSAEAFGFPQFVRAEEVDIPLEEGERNEEEEFGYWCRHVRR